MRGKITWVLLFVLPEICKIFPFTVNCVSVVLRYESVQKEGRFEWSFSPNFPQAAWHIQGDT